jgi:hypothetical protein
MSLSCAFESRFFFERERAEGAEFLGRCYAKNLVRDVAAEERRVHEAIIDVVSAGREGRLT